ncbi:MAG: proline iminopeptidase-family hydrolase [Oenococcus sp.]|uniref:proline iminopeptidase-family hydrolase n=1 Tax=Oenococcus sp. TaxID=1979414 RepID=UPI0039E92FE8
MKHRTQILHLKNGFDLWGARFGNPDAKIKILALHGGPGDDANEFIPWADQLQEFGGLDAEIYAYEQLGSFHSESPDFSKQTEVDKYLTLDRYVQEVDEVRALFGLDNFYLIGHSWGGMLTYEYMLRPDFAKHLKAGIVFSMTDNIADYVDQINQERLDMFGTQEVAYMQGIEKSGDFADQRYHKDLVALYKAHLNRDPNYNPDQGMAMMAEPVYNHFQGNNEFVVTGSMKGWDVSQRLDEINLPVLLTFGEYDTMPIASAKKSLAHLKHGRLAVTKDGGHSHAQDHPAEFFKHLGAFIREVEVDNV